MTYKQKKGNFLLVYIFVMTSKTSKVYVALYEDDARLFKVVVPLKENEYTILDYDLFKSEYTVSFIYVLVVGKRR